MSTYVVYEKDTMKAVKEYNSMVYANRRTVGKQNRHLAWANSYEYNKMLDAFNQARQLERDLVVHEFSNNL